MVTTAKIERQPLDTAEVSHLSRYERAAKSIQKGSKVLDVFCGSGYGSQILYKAGHQVTAFDKYENVDIEGVHLVIHRSRRLIVSTILDGRFGLLLELG